MASNQLISSAYSTMKGILSNGGKALLHSQYPNDFEYYLCSFELVDTSDGSFRTLEYLSLPIMPDNIRISDSKIQNTAKTMSGIVVLENNSFTPKTITINGNFGRRFKALDGDVDKSGVENIDTKDFKELFTGVKTGYGATKRLQRLIDNSSLIINGSPVMMLFYCYAFNANYVVQITNFSFEQNKGLNMIWEYSMSMTAIAPSSQILGDDKFKKTLNKYLKQDFLLKSAQKVANFGLGQTKLLANQKGLLDNVI